MSTGRKRSHHRPATPRSRCISIFRCSSVGHELRRAVRRGQGGVGEAAPRCPAPASARARAACCPRSRRENSRYFYELASGASAGAWTRSPRARPSTSRAGRAPRPAPADTFPATRSRARSPTCAGSSRAQSAISPPRFPDWSSLERSATSPTRCASRTGGIPIGYKLSAQHIEQDLDAALEVGVDYVILDGRGGGTGRCAAESSATTSPSRRFPRWRVLATTCDKQGARGRQRWSSPAACARRRTSAKALALGADAIAVSNAAHPGDRLPRDARLPHEQLPGRHRDPEAAPARSGCPCEQGRPAPRANFFRASTLLDAA